MTRIAQSDAEALLYLEARLIDEKRFKEWFSLYTEDCRYWVPANKLDVNPDEGLSYIYDSHSRLDDRVFRLSLPSMHSQNPASRTTHMVTNVEIDTEESNEDGEAVVRSCFLLREVREGDWRQKGLGLDGQGFLSGRYVHRLRFEEGKWRIVEKKVLLTESGVPISNMAFII